LKKAKELIYESLKEGRCFVANDYHGDSKGFKFFAESGNNTYQMGDEIKRNNNINLKVISPQKGDIRLIRSGKKIESIESDKAEFKITRKGVYRVEIYLNEKAWIFSNHIRVV
jgi:hypothetical protein